MTQPFLIRYPREIARLFWCGKIKSPSGEWWNVGFCPGVEGSWNGFQACWRVAKSCFNRAFSVHKHCEWVKDVGNFCSKLKEQFVQLLDEAQPMEGVANIRSLWEGAPFGWMFRILKNLGWNCLLRPICCVAGCVLGILVVTPTFFLVGSLGGIAAKLIFWGAGGLTFSFVGVLGIVLGIATSAFVALLSWPNRFPRPTDDGTYGIYRLLHG